MKAEAVRSPFARRERSLRARHRILSCFLLPALAACSNGDDGGAGTGGSAPKPPIEFGERSTGEGTYYDADGSGACSFDTVTGPLFVAALNAPDWAGSALCGACANVEGPNGSVTVRIVDLCPECSSGDLDLSPQAFAELAPLEQGRIPIEWTLASCEVTGPIRYLYKDGSNPWWTAVQVQNHRLPVAKFEWAPAGGEFQELERTDYNYFLTESGFGEGPVRVRVTAVDGQVLEDDLPPVQEGVATPGAAQFE